jgi:hypothetical protein
MSAAVAPDQPGLLFRWVPPRRRARALTLFIAISALVHALCFYLFQVVYPATGVSLITPARISFVSASNNEGKALLRWVDAEDPALTSATLRPPETLLRALPQLEHVPSYLTAQTPLKQPPPFVEDLRPPSPQPPGPVRLTTPAPVRPPTTPRTAIEFSEEIRALGPPTLPPTQFSASTREQPQNARFRVAVDQHGEVRYAFPVESSGDAQLDAQARQALVQTRLAIGAEPEVSDPAATAPSTVPDKLTWGIATVEWGGDIAIPPAATAATPRRP